MIAMSAATPSFPMIREAVASFPDRGQFNDAVAAVLAAGFQPSDLSVLASHKPLSAAEQKPGGPIAATVAALVGAGLGGAALKELFDDYAAAPHREEFAAALAEGAALLWVRCADSELELRALRILEEAGGRGVHIHGRPTGEAPSA